MFYTGRRIEGKEALAWGLCDQLVEPDDLRNSALALAKEIAEGAPLALLSTRATMRQGLADAVKAQTDHEFKEQSWLFKTEDHREGVKAVSETASRQIHSASKRSARERRTQPLTPSRAGRGTRI